MTAERRESMLTAVESPPGFDNLRALVKRYLDEGIRVEQLLEDLDQIRALVPDDVEELVLDVMDLLVGWCAPEFRLVREQKDELGRTTPRGVAGRPSARALVDDAAHLADPEGFSALGPNPSGHVNPSRKSGAAGLAGPANAGIP